MFENKLIINVSNIFLTNNIKKTILIGFFHINEWCAFPQSDWAPFRTYFYALTHVRLHELQLKLFISSMFTVAYFLLNVKYVTLLISKTKNHEFIMV